MHELAIAQSVVEIAAGHAGDKRVTRVDLKIGYLRQVVPSSLRFNFELVVRGTPIEGAELAVETVPVRGRCRACGAETVLETFPLVCAACLSSDLDIVAGDELMVASLEIEDTPAVL